MSEINRGIPGSRPNEAKRAKQTGQTHQLAGKTILITGAFGQAGQCAVRLFLERGAAVVANDFQPIERHPDMLRLREAYGADRFRFVQADALSVSGVERLMSDIDGGFGRLDGLFHNVYTNIDKTILESTVEEWESSVRGTLLSAFIVCKFALPLMIRSGGGAIVNTSSALGERPDRGNSAYGAAKAGVNLFTKALALEHAADGIRANAIVPGPFTTAEVYAGLTEEARQHLRDVTLLSRVGRPEEIVEAAAFLLSDAASYITGALVPVDGGYKV